MESRRSQGFPSRRRRLLQTVGLAILLGWAMACSRRAPSQEKPPEGGSPPVFGLTLAERIKARPAWLDSVPAAQFDKDPHTFPCVTCHGPRRQKTAVEWRNTCERAGCHTRAWPKTIFHRVRVSVFFNCLNCHRPHVWRLNGHDCLSCHGDMPATARGTVPVTQVSGVSVFSHERHGSLACSTCHVPEKTHADLKITSIDQCNACHHGPPPVAECSRCHQVSEMAGVRPVLQTMHIAGQAESRRLPFDHRRHAPLPCARCHEKSASPRPAVVCADCHANHHRAEANCVTCHPEPPAGVHTNDVHESGCGDCHGAGGFSRMEFRRNFCLVCHQNMTDHNPGMNCVTCHRIATGQEGR